MQHMKIERVMTPTMVKWIVAVSLNLYIIVFFFLRFFELIAMLAINPLDRVMVTLILIPSLSLIFYPPELMSGLAKRCGLIIIVLVSLKFEMDDTLQQKPNFRPYPQDMSGYVSIVTDAHTGIGSAISELLYHHGSTVIMTCPNLSTCQESIDHITLSSIPNHKLSHLARSSLVPMVMDYADLNSIYSFSQTMKSSNYTIIHHLILNSDTYQHTYPSFFQNILTPVKTFLSKLYRSSRSRSSHAIGTSVNEIEDVEETLTAQGYELYFGRIHLGKLALIKWILPLLLIDSQSISSSSSSSSSIPVITDIDSFACHDTTDQSCSNNSGNSSNNSSKVKAMPSSSSSIPSSSSSSSIPSRIVYVGSAAYMSGTFHSSLFHNHGQDASGSSSSSDSNGNNDSGSSDNNKSTQISSDSDAATTISPSSSSCSSSLAQSLPPSSTKKKKKMMMMGHGDLEGEYTTASTSTSRTHKNYNDDDDDDDGYHKMNNKMKSNRSSNSNFDSKSAYGRANLAIVLQAHELQTRIDKYVYLSHHHHDSLNNDGKEDFTSSLFTMMNNRNIMNDITNKSSNNSSNLKHHSISSMTSGIDSHYRQVITSVISTGNVAVTSSSYTKSRRINKGSVDESKVNHGESNTSSNNNNTTTITIFATIIVTTLTTLLNRLGHYIPTLSQSSSSSSWLNMMMTPFLRSADQVAYLVLYALCSHNYLPGSYIDAIGKPHDLFNYRNSGHLDTHLHAFFPRHYHHHQSSLHPIAAEGDTSSSSSSSLVEEETPSSTHTINNNDNNSNTNTTTTFQSPWHYSSSSSSSSSSLPLFARTPSLTYFSYDAFYFQSKLKFCYDCLGISRMTKGISATEVSNRLWKVTNNILEQFEKNHK